MRRRQEEERKQRRKEGEKEREEGRKRRKETVLIKGNNEKEREKRVDGERKEGIARRWREGWGCKEQSVEIMVFSIRKKWHSYRTTLQLVRWKHFSWQNEYVPHRVSFVLRNPEKFVVNNRLFHFINCFVFRSILAFVMDYQQKTSTLFTGPVDFNSDR